MEQKIEILEKKLAREKKAREILEEEIETKSRRLYMAYEYNQLVFNALGVGVIITNSSGEITSVNDRAKSFFPKIKFDDSQNVIEVLKIKSIKTEKFSTDPSTWANSDFEVSIYKRSYLVHITKISSKEDEFIFSLKDVTDQKKKERKIRALQDQTTESAYRDGVAENAISVLHNIGNVLTTIINRPAKTEALDQLSISNNILEKLVENLSSFQTSQEFSEFILNDEKGKQLIPLLKHLCDNFKDIEKVITDYAKFTEEKCFHIGSIISTQQKFANFKKKTLEDVNLFELISDCHKMHQDRIEKRGISIETNIDPGCQATIEKIGFAQVVSNIIINAIESMDERTQKDPFYNEKTLAIESVEADGCLIVSFKDNGIGIEDKTIKKLFKYGFSTKDRGSGFGLHNCANFMKKSGGKMEILSDGINQGAVVKLYCPLSSKLVEDNSITNTKGE